MADCRINPDTLTCTVCGASVPSADARRNCTPGLGDKVASVLSAVGIKKKEGCGCEKRQRWLNEFGRWVTGGGNAREAEDA